MPLSLIVFFYNFSLWYINYNFFSVLRSLIIIPLLTLSWRRSLSYRNQICGANQWTGFYVITASVIKELSISTEAIALQTTSGVIALHLNLVDTAWTVLIIHCELSQWQKRGPEHVMILNSNKLWCNKACRRKQQSRSSYEISVDETAAFTVFSYKLQILFEGGFYSRAAFFDKIRQL